MINWSRTRQYSNGQSQVTWKLRRLTFLIQARLMEPLFFVNSYRDSRIVWILFVDMAFFLSLWSPIATLQMFLPSLQKPNWSHKYSITTDGHKEEYPGGSGRYTPYIGTARPSADLTFFSVMFKILTFIWVCILICYSVVADSCPGSCFRLTHSSRQECTCSCLCEPCACCSFARSKCWPDCKVW